jgi:cation transport ATPase
MSTASAAKREVESWLRAHAFVVGSKTKKEHEQKQQQQQQQDNDNNKSEKENDNVRLLLLVTVTMMTMMMTVRMVLASAMQRTSRHCRLIQFNCVRPCVLENGSDSFFFFFFFCVLFRSDRNSMR